MIRIVGKRGKGSFESQLDDAAKDLDFVRIDCTSNNTDPVMREGLSPFYLGPVECYDGLVSQTFERAWQCAKVYPWTVGADGNPNATYFSWRDAMWAEKGFGDKMSIRFPVGKTNVGKCLYAWWKVEGEFKKLGYIDGRKHIYLPLYAKAVVKTEAYRRLVELRDSGIRVEDGEVKYADGLMEPTARVYSSDLRKLTEEQKLERGAKAAGVTLEEWTALSPEDRTLLRTAAKKENVYARGFTKAAWKRLPMVEKFAVIRGTNCR